jgi:hypothetical protein
VKSGKDWLAGWAAKDRADDTLEEGNSRIDLAQAFNTISEQTPVALRLLIAFKCEHQGCTYATAEGLRSAFKDYFERSVLVSPTCLRFNPLVYRVLGCQGCWQGMMPGDCNTSLSYGK